MENRKKHITLVGYFTAVMLGWGWMGLGAEEEPSAKADAEQKGLVTYVEGTTKKQKLGDQEWQEAPHNTEVHSGERVKTYRRSRAELELAKLDVVRLAPLTTLEINKLYEESKEQAIQTDLTVTEGNIWAQVGSVGDDAAFSINSPVAGTAIRGTVLRIMVGEDKSTELRVYKGEVAITNAPDKPDLQPRTVGPRRVEGPREVAGPREVSFDEWVYIIKQMQKIRINPEGKVVWSGEFKAEDPDEQSDWVKWNQARDQALKKAKVRPADPAEPTEEK